MVDESVLALNRRGKSYYDPYAGFNHLDPLDVGHLQPHQPPGGPAEVREEGGQPRRRWRGGLFEAAQPVQITSATGNPSIRPDRDGRAEIEFSVPDNLTGWRILALAVNPDDRMGLGDAGFKVNRPTELRPVMPKSVDRGRCFQGRLQRD